MFLGPAHGTECGISFPGTWAVTVHVGCHNLFLGQSSLACVTPLREDLCKCWISPHTPFSSADFAWCPFAVINLSGELDYMQLLYSLFSQRTADSECALRDPTPGPPTQHPRESGERRTHGSMVGSLLRF